LMNMKDEPQIAARASSMGNGRRLVTIQPYPRLDSDP
jgi:hypothetical protein